MWNTKVSGYKPALDCEWLRVSDATLRGIEPAEETVEKSQTNLSQTVEDI